MTFVENLSSHRIPQKNLSVSEELGPVVYCYGICQLLSLRMGAVVSTADCEISWGGEMRIMKKAKGKRLQNLQQIIQSWVCTLTSSLSLLLLISNNSSVTTPDFRNGELSDYVHIKCLALCACYINNS